MDFRESADKRPNKKGTQPIIVKYHTPLHLKVGSTNRCLDVDLIKNLTK